MGRPTPDLGASGARRGSQREASGRPLRAAVGAALACAASLSLTSCVTAADGNQKFDPWKAAVRTDDQLGEWLDNMGYPVEHTVKSER